MTEFSDKLASLINRERMAAEGDPARTADMIERQVHCFSFTLALCVPASRLPTVLAGVEQQLYESVTGFAPVAASIVKERAGS